MAAHYFVVPYRILADFYDADFEAAKDLHIEPIWYQEQLKKKWPSVDFSPLDFGRKEVLLSWKREIAKEIFGYVTILWDDYQTVTVRGADYEFILWHRSVIPAKFRLFVYNDSEMDDNILELTSDTTFQEMEKTFGKVLTPEELEEWAINVKKVDDGG